MSAEIEFKVGVIKPFECLREGWELIKPQYWLIFAITLVGLIISSAVPFGLALGAAYCGIYYAIFRVMRGEQAEFGDLFKGIQFFVPALVATLIFIIPIFIFTIISWVSVAGFFATMTSTNGEIDPSAIFGLYAVIFGEGIIFAIILSCIHAFIMFTYPLIVEHNMSGLDAFKLSSKAAWQNLGGVVGFILAEFLLGFVGYLVCGIGLYFVMPIMFAGALVMYRKVFPSESSPNYNPPPPNAYSGTGIQN